MLCTQREYWAEVWTRGLRYFYGPRRSRLSFTYDFFALHFIAERRKEVHVYERRGNGVDVRGRPVSIQSRKPMPRGSDSDRDS